MQISVLLVRVLTRLQKALIYKLVILKPDGK